MKQIKEKKQHFTKLKMRKEQIERVWAEHPEAMIQLFGGILIFAGTMIGVISKASGCLSNTETFYITDGEKVCSIDAKIEKTLSI